MTTLVIFKAQSLTELQKSPDGPSRVQALGIVADILGQHYLGSGNIPQQGDRLTEYKCDDQATTFDHRGGTTHYRPSPWQVTQVEEYVGNTGLEAMQQVAIAYCAYAPLPEQDNPWLEMAPAIVSLDSFDGDVAAYDAWKAKQVITA